MTKKDAIDKIMTRVGDYSASNYLSAVLDSYSSSLQKRIDELERENAELLNEAKEEILSYREQIKDLEKLLRESYSRHD